MKQESFYKQSIVLFAIVLPLLVSLISVIGIGSYRSSVAKKLKIKKADLVKETALKKELVAIREKSEQQKEQLEKWEALNSAELMPMVSEELQAISNKIPQKEYRQLSLKKSDSAALTVGLQKGIESTGIAMSYEGSVRGIQEGLLRFESALPSAVINSWSLRQLQDEIFVSLDAKYSILRK